MRKIIALVALATVAGCSGDSSTNATASINGTYTAQSINGSRLPFVLTAKSPPQTVTSVTLTVTNGTSWSSIKNFTTTVNGVTLPTSKIDGGAVSLSGSMYTFTGTDPGSVITGTLSGNALTLTIAPEGYVYLLTK